MPPLRLIIGIMLYKEIYKLTPYGLKRFYIYKRVQQLIIIHKIKKTQIYIIDIHICALYWP